MATSESLCVTQATNRRMTWGFLMNSIGSKTDPARPAPNACGSIDGFIVLFILRLSNRTRLSMRSETNETEKSETDCSFDCFVDEINKYAQRTISFLCLEYNHSKREILRWFTPFVGNQRRSTKTQQINIINIFRTIYVSCHLSAVSLLIVSTFLWWCLKATERINDQSKEHPEVRS